MDLFELLFIALFIIFPIMEGILKQRRKGQGAPPPEDNADAEWSEGEEPRSAADMVPDDLWEIMTGEKRPSGEGGADREEAAGEPWSSAPGGAPTHTPAPESEPEVADPVSEDWRSESWVLDDEAEVPEPESLEYEGPEAYTLEKPAPEPIARRAPSAEARHRAFHELVDRQRPKKKRRLSTLMKALKSPDGLRQAVLLKEVLGPPKGLE